MSRPPQKARPRRLRDKEKVHQALELRKAGASYQSIATSLGLKSKSRAHDLVMEGLRELESVTKESAEELRRLMLERLDSLQMALWKGRSNPRNADTLLRLEARRAALLGLDAPQKIAPTTPDGEALPPPVAIEGLPLELARQLREHLKASQPTEG